MSILSLQSAPYATVDSRYVQTMDLEVLNSGSEAYEMLIHMYGDQGLYDLHLICLHPGVIVALSDITTNYMPFRLVMVTNINQSERTEVIVRVKNNGIMLAVYTRADMTESI